MYWFLIIQILIAGLLTGCGIGICYFLVSRFKKLKPKVLISFLIYGLLAGALSVWVRSDAILLLNIPGVMLGDEVYNLAIRYLGDPSSPQAHFTVPWILRIPQVYILVSAVFWGLIGLIIKLIYNRLKNNIE